MPRSPRLDLGEHWFADILASYFLGLTCLVALIPLYRWSVERGKASSGMMTRP